MINSKTEKKHSEIVITYNGQIYNTNELRKTLEEYGFTFTSYSDTEVLLKSYIFYGKDVVHHLNGIFSFAIWDSEKEEYFFSVIDIISALTESNNPRNYWNTLKRRMTEEEKSELYAKCVQLKMKSPKDGKNYLTDTLDTKGILRLIESIPSPNAEPFKLWLAQMGKERIDEVFDPELAVNRAVDYYRSKRI